MLITHVDQKKSIIDDLSVYLMLLISLILLLGFLLLLMVVIKKLRNKIKGILFSIKKKTLWNGAI